MMKESSFQKAIFSQAVSTVPCLEQCCTGPVSQKVSRLLSFHAQIKDDARIFRDGIDVHIYLSESFLYSSPNSLSQFDIPESLLLCQSAIMMCVREKKLDQGKGSTCQGWQICNLLQNRNLIIKFIINEAKHFMKFQLVFTLSEFVVACSLLVFTVQQGRDELSDINLHGLQ